MTIPKENTAASCMPRGDGRHFFWKLTRPIYLYFELLEEVAWVVSQTIGAKCSNTLYANVRYVLEALKKCTATKFMRFCVRTSSTVRQKYKTRKNWRKGVRVILILQNYVT